MVKTARACYSLAVLACSSSGPRISSAFFLVGSRSSPFSGSRALSTTTSHKTSTSHADITMSSDIKEEVNVASNLELVKQRVQDCASGGSKVRLVAVSKTKPIAMLKEAYDAGHRVFGENYVQELVGKAKEMPSDISWHYIGPLQSNKANLLVKSVEKLTVETVATVKLANKLNNAVQQDDSKQEPVAIYIQVNTSGEESKSGVVPGADTVELCRHVLDNCPNLSLAGLMTIGAPGDTSCFDVLVECKDQVETELNVQLELSMGMSSDFETAIEHGATSVRVGSTIFGARDYSNLKK